MRSRKVFLVSSVLCVWVFATCYFLLRQTGELNYHRKDILQKLNYLESGVRRESETQNNIARSLIEFIQAKAANYQTTEHQNAKGSQHDDDGGGAAMDVPRVDGNDAGADVDAGENHVVERGDYIQIVPLEDEKDSEDEQQMKMPKSHNEAVDGPIIPVLVLACNRVSVSKCLDNLIQYRPSEEQFPIIVSQDCGDEATRKVILSYKDQVTLITQPDLSDIPVPPKEKKFKGYYKIARHYQWALNTTFKQGFDNVIIVEDDLNVAPDFFEYFLGTQPILKADPSLWCVSAWNDNGKQGLVDTSKPELLYRTDFFPGLGWMLTKELWNELGPKWPKSFWDDWIRQPQQRKNRACIRPELSRTRTFGKIGVSNGLFFDKYLKYIKLSEDYVNFRQLNLTYLLKDNYDNSFIKHVYSCPIVTYEELRRGLVNTRDPIRIQYTSRDQYKRTAKMLGLMDDFKSGVPRTGYHGIISFFYNNQRVYLAPNANWKGYDLTWS